MLLVWVVWRMEFRRGKLGKPEDGRYMSSFHEEMRERGLPRLPGKKENFNEKILEYRTGDITQEEFLDYLQRERMAGQAILAEFSETNLDAETWLAGKELFEAGRRGVEYQLQAISMLEQWASSPDKSLQDGALAMAAQGDSMLNDGIAHAWELCLTLDEAAEELLDSMGAGPAV